MALNRPAQKAMSCCGTLNDCIISGRYGKMLVSEMGSAKRHIALRNLSKLSKLRMRRKQHTILLTA